MHGVILRVALYLVLWCVCVCGEKARAFQVTRLIKASPEGATDVEVPKDETNDNPEQLS